MDWKVISIDGAPFVITIPTTDMLEDLDTINNMEESCSDDFPWDTGSMITQDLGDKCNICLSAVTQHVVLEMDKDMRLSNADTQKHPWRPALIPLTPDGFLDNRFWADNPVGPIFEGGSFRKKHVRQYSPETLLTTDGNTFEIVDTDNKQPIQWYCGHGAMICFQELAFVRPMELAKQHLCFPATRLFYQARLF